MTSLTRVTQSTLTAASLAGLEDNLARVQQLQDQVSSGFRVNRPSDAPADAVDAMAYRAQIRRTQQYQSNIADGLSFLGTTDSTLQSMVTSIQRARDLLVQAGDGSLSTQGRAAIADEIDQLRQSLLGEANTQYLGRPIFGGTAPGSQAYDSTGAYVGDGGSVTRTIAAGTTVAVNVTGPATFGAAGSDLFTVLGNIAADVRAPQSPSAQSADLASLDVVASSVSTALSQVGARYNQLQSAQTHNGTVLTALQSGLSAAEDIDLPKSITDLQMQQVTYQASLAATAKVIQPSLVDFLR